MPGGIEVAIAVSKGKIEVVPDLPEKPTGWGGDPVAQPSLEKVKQAAKLLHGVIVQTPLVPLKSYQEPTTIQLKPETLQPIGSYKLRGVYNWAASLSRQQLEAGLSTHSAGNTAQALGYVAQLVGAEARSLLPDRTPQVKIDAIRRYGVTPVIMPFEELLEYIFRAGWEQEPYSYLNPWADPLMIAGNGTIGLEILDQLPQVDTIYVPVGGGGLIAGIGSAVKAAHAGVRVVAVQPEACPALKASFDAGKPVWVDSQPTICDTTVPLAIDETFQLLKQVVDEVVLVSEAEIRSALRQLALENKLIVEGAGALSVAAALATPLAERGNSVCILSGSSLPVDKLTQILSEE